MSTKRLVASALLILTSLVLAACMLLPGKFGSDLTLHRDGTFSFSYKGEIFLLPLSKLAQDKPSGVGEKKPFTPSPCRDEGSDASRPCTKAEVDAQRAAWDVALPAAAQRDAENERMAKTWLGGLDPSDPKAADAFAERLSRQAGWKSVINRGDGRFEVEYAVSGRLDHDFSFPMIERMPAVMPFVTMIRRADGSVRIDAPAFASSASASPLMAMLAEVAKDKAKGGDSTLPQMDGTFTLHTDGAILANNTDEGARPDPAGQRLDWKVDARSAAMPTALIRLDR